MSTNSLGLVLLHSVHVCVVVKFVLNQYNFDLPMFQINDNEYSTKKNQN